MSMDLNLLLLETSLGFVIGLVVGLLGGGGSILTVPALVYIIGQSPHAAIAASLVIVGLNSLTGVYFHRQQGNLQPRIALLFGGVGMITAYVAALWSRMFPPTVLMIAFAVLMLTAGSLMILRRQSDAAPSRTPQQWPVTMGAGAVVGVLTGLLGVGGGFMIVPALVMLVGLPIREAIGTSLIVIVMNSLAGLLGHLGSTTLDASLLAVFVGAGIAGTFAGTQVAQRIQPARLQQIFALFIILLGLFLLYDNLRAVLG